MANEQQPSSNKHSGILEKKLEFMGRYPIISLSIIIGVSLFLRFSFFPFGVPITLDGLLYFWYAIDISILGHLPTGYTVANNGWPIFLSFFFSAFHSNNFMDYMFLQRVITIGISTLTIIPIYLLCRKFVNTSYAMIGAAIFALEPRVIQNSMLGLTDPLYIMLVTVAIGLFLSENRKFVYIAFGVTALASLVRSEGLFLFLALSIVFFIRNGRTRKVIPRYAIVLGIFLLIVLPVAILRIQTTGNDELSGRIPSEINRTLILSSDNGKSNLILFASHAFENFFKFLGWSMIPMFIFFIPVGIILILKNRDHQKITIIITAIVTAIPILYALSTALDTRYFLPLYPLFCVLSVYAIKEYDIRLGSRKIFLILLVGGIIFSSSLFLDVKKIDIEHEKEALSLAYQVANRTDVINSYYPESGYLVITTIAQLDHFPSLHSQFKGEPVKQINIQANDIAEYIKQSKEMGLTHLVLDGTDNIQNRPIFFKDVFLHEEKYPYLIKIYDSSEHGYKYHLKIFKIDYNKFRG